MLLIPERLTAHRALSNTGEGVHWRAENSSAQQHPESAYSMRDRTHTEFDAENADSGTRKATGILDSKNEGSAIDLNTNYL